jgi:hypothetical protein
MDIVERILRVEGHDKFQKNGDNSFAGSMTRPGGACEKVAANITKGLGRTRLGCEVCSPAGIL